MEKNAVAEILLFAFLEFEVADALFLALKVVNAERVRGDEAVVAGVPPRRMTQIIRVIKDGNADRVAIDLAPVIDPLGALAPECLVLVAGAVERMAVGSGDAFAVSQAEICLLYTSPSPRDRSLSRMPSSA